MKTNIHAVTAKKLGIAKDTNGFYSVGERTKISINVHTEIVSALNIEHKILKEALYKCKEYLEAYKVKCGSIGELDKDLIEINDDLNSSI